ncbi:GHKL domain-containing protein [Rhodocytophaga rosea]|uniref:histidine kinase n=1 Tax=Rhodocytophaga rosea TaxID=2704465 RepID=A0A6C0GSA3_9BACT|nr:sensor histidine kinase [Rhodocytophaga rosea]QHT70981.1 GHKL domain-containing protein [Rhodocytophaga rosea]
MKLLLVTAFLCWLTLSLYASPVDTFLVSTTDTKEYHDLTPYIQAVNDPKGVLSISTMRAKDFVGSFKPLNDPGINVKSPVHWLHFYIQNPDTLSHTVYISFTFTDFIEFYIRHENGAGLMKKSGDLVPFHERDVKVGQMVFIDVPVPPQSVIACYARLESSTDISQQSRSLALKSIKLYSEASFDKRFDVTNRIYQALFYGAMLIMLFYNLFIFITLKDSSYLYYVCYTLAVGVFFSSNSGYIFELFLPEYPRTDLYVRFLSTPVLLFFYLLFSRKYLKTANTAPVLNKAITLLLFLFPVVFILMMLGYWTLGRSASIIGAIISFVFILFAAISSVRKGYTPALFFLVANILLLVGGAVYASQRFFAVEQSPITQYSVQIASVLEVVLFSFGLAARINLMQKEITDKTIENERLEKVKERALKSLIEEKNQELEQKVKERTAQIHQQKEEITTQNDYLTQSYKQLEQAQQTIEKQNKKLSLVNVRLEKTVRERTKELKQTNTDLLKANRELDIFIYRTAHDIKGPLARLIGLSQVALLDVQEQQAIEYLNKLNFEANYLNYLLNRLSVIHEITHAEVRFEPIDFQELMISVIGKLHQVSGFDQVQIHISVGAAICIDSDHSILSFILRNLIENAIQFRKPDAAASFITVEVKHQEMLIIIQVTDNGIGISPIDTPTIFDLFSRAAGKHKKAGMGLHMTKLSVEKLKGNISLLPHPSGFTQFQVSLPVKNA